LEQASPKRNADYPTAAGDIRATLLGGKLSIRSQPPAAPINRATSSNRAES
jgi:hypothetical protein